MELYAHITRDENTGAFRYQTLQEHSLHVSATAGKFAGKIGLEHCGKLIGLLHDMGKAHVGFQDYLCRSVNGENLAKMDHASIGAKEILRIANNEMNAPSAVPKNIVILLKDILANVVAGHHMGLMDFLSPDGKSPFLTRMRNDLPYTSECVNNFYATVVAESNVTKLWGKALEEFGELLKTLPKEYREKENYNDYLAIYSSLTCFLYSVLIDADRLDAFCFDTQSGELMDAMDKVESWESYGENLEEFISHFSNDGKINKLRKEISDWCYKSANGEAGLYSLTVPVGGGKTLASLRFAINHAILNKKRKIFYIMPYISIIEQNAQVLRDALQMGNELLEFHSQVEQVAKQEKIEDLEIAIPVKDDSEISRAGHLFEERWDKPLVCTSFVQFLNAFYEDKSAANRRLHQLAEAVIIIDETQAVPLKLLHFFWHACRFLTDVMHSTVLLMTATQPNLKKLAWADGGGNVTDLLPQISDKWDDFRRVMIEDRTTGGLFRDGSGRDDVVVNLGNASDFLESELAEVDSLLWVFNTKRSMREVYKVCQKEGRHIEILDNWFCPQHRKDKIQAIRDKLAQIAKAKKDGKPIRDSEKFVLFSTQLIEAGVDISFEKAIRSLASMVSVWQTAGRCNRNGERDLAKVIIVGLSDELEHLGSLIEINNGKNASRQLFQKLLPEENDLNAFPIQEKYFTEERRITNRTFRNEQILKEYPSRYNHRSLWNIWTSNEEGTLACKDPGVGLIQGIRTVKKEFEVISDDSISVVVPYGTRGREIIAKLGSECVMAQKFGLLQELQLYSISIPKGSEDINSLLFKLKKEGAIRDCWLNEKTVIYILGDSYYNEEGFLPEGGAIHANEYQI